MASQVWAERCMAPGTVWGPERSNPKVFWGGPRDIWDCFVEQTLFVVAVVVVVVVVVVVEFSHPHVVRIYPPEKIQVVVLMFHHVSLVVSLIVWGGVEHFEGPMLRVLGILTIHCRGFMGTAGWLGRYLQCSSMMFGHHWISGFLHVDDTRCLGCLERRERLSRLFFARRGRTSQLSREMGTSSPSRF